MTRKLRSNLEPGTALWAGRIAQWRALGISDEDMAKPKIAIVNSSSELSSCFSHLDGVAAEIKAAIRAAGGLPFEVRTAAPSDFITSVGRHGAYILPSRDLIAADIEVQVEGAQLDGMVCLASCDKTTPGQLMAAGRLDIPSLVVICGYQRSGEYRGEHVDIEEVFLKSGSVASGGITVDELKAMANVAVQSPGVCAGMGTANSMHTVCEALGMALPGSAPVAALSPKMLGFVRLAGARIVEMVWQDLKPRQIITAGSVRNAVAIVLALSGSINCVKHLQAIATEAGVDVDVYGLFADLADKIPLLAAIRPNGPGLIEELEAAGGARAVLKRLEPFLDLEARTVTGTTLREVLADVTVADERVIRPLAAPLSTRP
ncbi:MAG TPA: dihydroxy-acid dehydratase, partial [Gammaproteobacteria bacterium]|nr:dihydroxy-acid dehydratase [Gammaproteobacteria bacterium]